MTKEELLDLAWPGLVVEENNLQVQVSSLRKVLGPAAIATSPGRGYRFTLPLGAPARTLRPADASISEGGPGMGSDAPRSNAPRGDSADRGRSQAAETITPVLGPDGRWRVAAYFIS